jgi:hypothetical protein
MRGACCDTAAASPQDAGSGQVRMKRASEQVLVVTLLMMVYAYAVFTAVLLIASGYVNGSWLTQACSADSVMCQHPFLALIPLVILMGLYRWAEQQTAPIHHPVLRRIKLILD